MKNNPGLPRPKVAGIAMTDGVRLPQLDYEIRNDEGGVKIAIAQIEVVAGRPDLNTSKILKEVENAKKRGVDLILFSEMVVPGYLLGDEWENDSFLDDLMEYNEDIRKASQDITVIWGSVFVDKSKKGEDGRVRKYNTVYLAQNGKWISNGVFDGHTFKTLMPKYREFDDERHFYSMLRLANESKKSLKDLLKPFKVDIDGKKINIGAILCEDMWSDDYADNPSKILVENGAELIVNLSCSPWTWRKNDKRNRVVKSLLEEVKVPFLYCNNIGIQNNGKNVFLFDGNSTAYNKDGEIAIQAKDYVEETVDVLWSEIASVRRIETRNDGLSKLSDERDVEELYTGLVFGLKRFFETNKMNRAVLGLSGGVDSAVSTCLLAEAIGTENVFAVNMPSKFNSDLTKNAALELADNLGVNYGVLPIQESVDLTVKQLESLEFERRGDKKTITNVEVTGYSLENIQARDRGSRVLAGIAACLGAVFTNNGNKTETTIGWCTLYGDVNGAIAPIADIYKGEVYQLARYINRLAGKEIIPEEILNVIPSAELSDKQDVTKGLGDPILYPYHDRLFRSFVEFRRDPEYILELYAKGELEKELKIEAGLVAKYFPTPEAFIADLEHKWKQYKINVFKRIQAPPIIAVSRRAFGFDLREAQNGVYFTRGYEEMKKELLKVE